jgi:putative GTP pyrophosphokinase
MTELEFNQWLLGQQIVLDAFGKFVVSKLKKQVLAELPAARALGFFKIEPSFRVKELTSALSKQRKKKHADPEYQMTDLVGARFIVLLRSDIALVESSLIGFGALWTSRRDREPKMEADLHPDAFRYQSVHYIVRSVEEQVYEGVTIPADTACEIQIRTLLQHAYAELSHDLIYKGEAVVTPSVHRLVARSMALMETTDHLFCEAVEELGRINKDIAAWCAWLDKAYRTVGTCAIETHDDDDAVNILETYMDLLKAADEQVVSNYFQHSVIETIRMRPKIDDLFSRPIVMLVYWLVSHHGDEALRRWPLPKFKNDLELIAADLGISFD